MLTFFSSAAAVQGASVQALAELVLLVIHLYFTFNLV